MSIPSWRSPKERAPGDWVLGDTNLGGGDRRRDSLRILSENQQYFAGDDTSGSWNVGGSAALQYSNYAFPLQEGGVRRILMQRIHEFLIYNAKSAVLVWGTLDDEEEQQSLALDDTDQIKSYGVVDLEAVSGLAIGRPFWIETTIDESSDDEDPDQVFWALQWPGHAWGEDPLTNEDDTLNVAGGEFNA